MPNYLIEISKEDHTDECKHHVLPHCNIQYFFNACFVAGWIITSCIEVDNDPEVLDALKARGATISDRLV